MAHAMTHETLDEALAYILSDTYGHNNVERETDEDDRPTGRYVTSVDPVSDDTVEWTYEDGLIDLGGCDDHTRLMESYEIIDEPRYLRWHFPQIEEFEGGMYHALTFEFAIVDHEIEAHTEDCDMDTDDHYNCDRTVGYIYELYIYE